MNTLPKAHIHQVFNKIAPTYDLINKILSLGIDRYWRGKVADHLSKDIPIELLDLATGTGDQIFSICKRRKNMSTATGIDMAEEMLKKAFTKAEAYKKPISFKKADALALPFGDGSFNAITMSFGIRNVTSLEKCFSEMHRVLQKQGHLCILEFSLPKNKLFRSIYLFYLRHLLPRIGGWLSKNKEAYSYLNQTIESFPYGKAFCDLLKNSGFKSVSYKPLSFGIVTLYMASK